jgi:hypothetical protein
MSGTYTVFVLGTDGKPLTPTTPAKARKLLTAGVAKKVWSKFGTFGIHMKEETRQETPLTTLGYDPGSKFEGYAVVCDQENILSVKVDLPDKDKIVKKLRRRKTLRRSRRYRKCRRRPARFHNRVRVGFIAPSQRVIVQSRLKVLGALFAIYPISRVGLEDVRFNHAKQRWGKHFSTAEIGKKRLLEFLQGHRVQISLFQAFETQELRVSYGYHKTAKKAANTFSAHCTDALALACSVGSGQRVEPGMLLIIDDTYRPVRRKLQDEEPAKGGKREKYSHGTVFGVQKGRLIGTRNGKKGQLYGEYKGGFRFYDQRGKRQNSTKLSWISTQFVIRKGEEQHSYVI